MADPFADEGPAAAGRAQLCAALAMVERAAGERGRSEESRDETQARATAYAAAAPIAQRRFDAVLTEASRVADAGIAALGRYSEALGRDCAPAAEQLATELRASLHTLDRLVPLR